MQNNLKMRENRYVIESRNKNNNLEEKVISRELIKLTPTKEYKLLKAKSKFKDLCGIDISELFPEKAFGLQRSNDLSAFITKEHKKPKKHKKGKKHKKDKKKNKKRCNELLECLSDNLCERVEKSSNLMAELLKYSDKLCIVDRSLWLYDDNEGCFNLCNSNDAACRLRMLLPENERLKVTTREYKEAYEQLRIQEELKIENDFFSNGALVNCLNGVVDVRNNTLIDHSPEYQFKHCIQANFDKKAECTEFLKYINLITDGDDELKKLIQVMFGYILSHYNNAKTAFLLYGISNTGKSVLCKIMEKVVGEKHTCHIDVADLHKQEYAASLHGNLLNIAPDIKNGQLKDVGFFKSLTSHNDTIMAKLSHRDPGKVKGETKMLFSTNHLITFDSKLCKEDIEAVFNRLVYIPFLNKPINEEADNKNIAMDIATSERDGIFTWAMEGLKNYIETGEIFPKCKVSSKLKAENMVHYCPEKTFFDVALKREDGVYASSTKVKNIYKEFCRKHGINNYTGFENYVINHEGIVKTRKRVDDDGYLTNKGNPIAVYKNLKIRKKYMDLLEIPEMLDWCEVEGR